MATVDDLINTALSNSASLLSGAQGALDSAINSIAEPMITIPGALSATLPENTYAPGEAPVPSITMFSAGTIPAAPDVDYGMMGAYTGDAMPFPEFDATMGAMDVVSKPAETRAFSGTLPTLSIPDIPPPPEDLSPTIPVPVITDIVVPAVPTTTLPTFDAVRPDVDLAPPTGMVEKYESDYANMAVNMRASIDAAMDAELTKINPQYHTQMALLEDKLTAYIAGGTALTPEVEQAIYNRGRDRVNAEYEKVRTTIMSEGASLGFTIPGGAQYAALALARQGAADNNARAAMEIAIKQAELEQQNIQFAITQSANLRGLVLNAVMTYMGNLIQINGQAMQYAQNVMNATVALYEITVKLVTAQIEIYRADAQVYEAKLKASLAVYELFRAQIEALKAQTDVDKAKVDVYTARLNAMKMLNDIYESRIRGMVAQIEIEKLKVNIYEADIRAYSAEVAAKSAEWQGYVAQLEGNKAKVAVYAAQVDAFGTEVEAYKAQQQVTLSRYEAYARVGAARWQGYAAQVQAFGEGERAKAAVSQAETAAFSAEAQAYIAAENTKAESAKANMAAAEASARILLSQATMENNTLMHSASQYNAYTQGSTQSLISAASVYSSMAGSAMAGLNVLGASVETTDTTGG